MLDHLLVLTAPALLPQRRVGAPVRTRRAPKRRGAQLVLALVKEQTPLAAVGARHVRPYARGEDIQLNVLLHAQRTVVVRIRLHLLSEMGFNDSKSQTSSLHGKQTYFLNQCFPHNVPAVLAPPLAQQPNRPVRPPTLAHGKVLAPHALGHCTVCSW